MISKPKEECRLEFPMFSTHALGNHESFANEDERLAMNWVIHQASGVRGWEQGNRDSSIARRPIVFEIGTFWGLSLIDFSSMVPGATLHSLDIGAAAISDSPQQRPHLPADVGRYAKEQGVKFVQHLGDSLSFHYSVLPAPLDVVFIDGRHDRQHVVNDTEKTLPLLISGGVMVWHDYKENDPATVEMVEALNDLDGRWFEGNLTRISDTSLVYWVKSSEN